jgi:hypothetical protein
MCKNATSTVAAAMAAIRPTVVSVLTVLNVVNTPDGEAALSAFDAAQAALANWQQGTSAETVIELINAFTETFNAVVAAIPVVPPELAGLIDVISAGLVVVISVLTGNSGSANTLDVMAAAEAKVKALVPGWKESTWDKARAALGDHMVVANEYKKQWNKGVSAAAKVDSKYASLKLS